MTLTKNAIGGYDIICLNDEDLRDMLIMIQGAPLPQRRTFEGLRASISQELGAAK